MNVDSFFIGFVCGAIFIVVIFAMFIQEEKKK